MLWFPLSVLICYEQGGGGGALVMRVVPNSLIVFVFAFVFILLLQVRLSRRYVQKGADRSCTL